MAHKVDPSRREIAIQVLSGAKIAKEWALGEAKFLGIDTTTENGKNTLIRLAREHAAKLIDNR